MHSSNHVDFVVSSLVTLLPETQIDFPRQKKCVARLSFSFSKYPMSLYLYLYLYLCLYLNLYVHLKIATICNVFS